MAIGIVARHKTTFLQPDRRKMWLASIPVMNRAKVERIPLHSFAISISTPGNEKLKPCQKTGTPKILNRPYVIPALPFWRPRTASSNTAGGIGIVNRRKDNGKMAARKDRVP